MADKIKGITKKAFNNAGTGEAFEANKTYDFDAGAYANYIAAGLIEPVSAAAASIGATEPAKAKA